MPFLISHLTKLKPTSNELKVFFTLLKTKLPLKEPMLDVNAFPHFPLVTFDILQLQHESVPPNKELLLRKDANDSKVYRYSLWTMVTIHHHSETPQLQDLDWWRPYASPLLKKFLLLTSPPGMATYSSKKSRLARVIIQTSKIISITQLPLSGLNFHSFFVAGRCKQHCYLLPFYERTCTRCGKQRKTQSHLCHGDKNGLEPRYI